MSRSRHAILGKLQRCSQRLVLLAHECLVLLAGAAVLLFPPTCCCSRVAYGGQSLMAGGRACAHQVLG